MARKLYYGYNLAIKQLRAKIVMMVLRLLFIICRNIIEEMKQTECLWRLLKYFTTTAVDFALLWAHSLIENSLSLRVSMLQNNIMIFALLMRFNPYGTVESARRASSWYYCQARQEAEIMGFIFCKIRKVCKSGLSLFYSTMHKKTFSNSSLSTDYLHCISTYISASLRSSNRMWMLSVQSRLWCSSTEMWWSRQ